MSPAQLCKTLRKMRAALNTLTIEGIALNSTVNNLISLVDSGSTSIEETCAAVHPMGEQLSRFCDALEIFQELALYLAGVEDTDDEE